MKNADIEAALIWRPGVLRTSKDLGAQAFLNVMSLRPIPELTVSNANNPLSLAASSLYAEFHGDLEQARNGYELLSKSEDLLVQILGKSLHAWMESSPPQVLESAIQSISGIDDALTRCSLYCKFMTFALDKGDFETASKMQRGAYESASNRRSMRDALDWVSATYLGGAYRFRPRSGLVDPRVDVREITAIENDSGRKFVAETVLKQSRSAWSQRITFGRRDIDDLYSAELQSAWSGSMWKLRELRLHLGARILVSRTTPDEIGRGVSLWILGGGSEVGGVFDEAERQFDLSTTESIFKRDLLGGRRAGAQKVFPELCAQAWDLVDESTAEEWLQELLPSDNSRQGTNFEAQLWSLLSLRCTTAWANAFQALSAKQKESVVLAFPFQIGSDISPVVSDEILNVARATLRQELQSDSVDLNRAQVLGEIILNYSDEVRNSESEDFSFLFRLPDAIRAHIAFKARELAPRLQVEDAIATLTAKLQTRRANLEAGTIEFQPFDYRLCLAMAAISIQKSVEEVVQFMVEDARNSRLPVEERLAAMQTLQLMVSEEGRDIWGLSDLLADIGQSNMDFGPFASRLPNEMLRLWQMLFVWQNLDKEHREFLILSSSRHADPRVRATAVSVASSIAKDETSEWLESIILAALYDPDREVLSTGIRATAALQFNPSLLQSAVERLKVLLTSESRRIRAEICRVANVAAATHSPNPFSELNEIGSKDRSWLVRFESRGRLGIEHL